MCKKKAYWIVMGLMLILASAVSADLVAHWPLDGDYGDATGNGHDGTPLGAPTFVDDAERGGSVLEVGGSSYVMVADAPDLNYGADQSLTMTAWVLWDSALAPGGWRGAVVKGRTAPGGGTGYTALMYAFFVHPNGNWTFHAGSFVNPTTVRAVSGEWTHLAFVQDGPNNEAHVFVNLEEIASGPAASCDTTGRPLFIGASGTDTGPAFEPFGGRISDVRIYNEPLLGEALAETTLPLAPPVSATDPSPAHESIDVPRDTVWA